MPFSINTLSLPKNYLFRIEGNDCLVLLLLSANLLWLAILLSIVNKLFQAQFAILILFTFATIKASITLFKHFWQWTLFKNVSCIEQCTGHSIHTTDMSDKDIFRISAVTTKLCIEV